MINCKIKVRNHSFLGHIHFMSKTSLYVNQNFECHLPLAEDFLDAAQELKVLYLEREGLLSFKSSIQ